MTSNLDKYWYKVAAESAPDCHPVLPLIASLLMGLGILVNTSSIPAAIAGGGAGMWMSMNRAIRSGKQLDAIYDGYYAISLDADGLRQYTIDYGIEATKAQLLDARERGFMLSEAAEDLLDRPTPVVPTQVPLIEPQLITTPTIQFTDNSEVLASAIEPQIIASPTTTIQANVPKVSKDFLESLLPKLQNYCFIGLPRSGKDYLCSLMAEEAKRLFPNTKIFVINPKGDPNESPLWEGIADRMYEFVGFETSSREHVRHVKAAFEQFKNVVKESKGEHRWVLVYNEFTTSSLEFKASGDAFLASELPKLIAMGDSLKMNLWLMAQSPHMNAGLDGSVLGMFARLLIIQPENLGTFEGWQKTQLMAGVNLDRVRRVCENSEMGRAVFCSALDERWLSMPRLARKTRWYCRESEQWVGDSPESVAESLPQLPDEVTSHIVTSLPSQPPSHLVAELPAESVKTATFKDSAESPSHRVTELATPDLEPASLEPPTPFEAVILEFFTAAQQQQPKALRDIKQANRIKNLGIKDSELLTNLNSLVQKSELNSPMVGYWTLPGWSTVAG